MPRRKEFLAFLASQSHRSLRLAPGLTSQLPIFFRGDIVGIVQMVEIVGIDFDIVDWLVVYLPL